MRYENMTLAELELLAYTTGNKLALAIYEKCHDKIYTEEEMKEIEEAEYDKGFIDGHNEGWSDAKSDSTFE